MFVNSKAAMFQSMGQDFVITYFEDPTTSRYNDGACGLLKPHTLLGCDITQTKAMAKSKLKGRKEDHKFYLEREKEIERKREAIRTKKVR